MISGIGNIVIEDKVLISAGHTRSGGSQPYTLLQELVPLNGLIQSSALESPISRAHCIIQINATTIMMTGGVGLGGPALPSTWFQNFETGETIKGPDLSTKTNMHGCGKININGDTVLFNIGVTDKTEYLNLNDDNLAWKSGTYILYLSTTSIL